MREKKQLKYVLILLIIGTCLGFMTVSFIHGTNNKYIFGTGEIEFYPDEGGFYGIISDDGIHYEPINLPDEFKIDALRVLFIFKIPNDSTSYHLWLKIVEIFDIMIAPY
ncbi:MAG: hypothetical protein ACFFE5_10145 [Candidatus Thorarchaeota archaeon]